MRNTLGLSFSLFWSLFVVAQDVSLPEDLRQHNLTQFNSSLLNPTFSLDWNEPSAISLWSRWQWQSIDGDPTTIFLNYTGTINSESAFGVGFLQHNTGTFLNTGGILNYAHAFDLGTGVKVLVGANILGFQQKLADDRFVPDDDLDLPQLEQTNDFLLQVSPAARLVVNDFSLALALENAFGTNAAERENSGSIFIAALSNDFPVALLNDGGSIIRPMVYLKTIPDGDTQVGINALLATSKFWAQGGYNSFYGPGVGLGVTVLKSLSIGGLFEFATGSELAAESSTFELLLSYNFGRTATNEKEMDTDVDETESFENDSLQQERERLEKEAAERRRQEAERLQQEKDSIAEVAIREERNRNKARDSISQAKVREAQRIQDSLKVAQQEEAERLRKETIRLQRESDSISRAQAREERRRAAVQDSINQVEATMARQRTQDSLRAAKQEEAKRLQAETIRLQREKDSLDRVRVQDSINDAKQKEAVAQNQEVEVKPDEKYEEVSSSNGLEPGFYLIANVFGTKKYFEKFMKTLKDRGLDPKSFYRDLNGYNYVYLERYGTIEEARKARDSKFNGKYLEKTWIFRVRGN